LRTPSYEPLIIPNRIYPYPVGDRSLLDRVDKFEQKVKAGRYRVILSGIGGDELLARLDPNGCEADLQLQSETPEAAAADVVARTLA